MQTWNRNGTSILPANHLATDPDEPPRGWEDDVWLAILGLHVLYLNGHVHAQLQRHF